MCPIIKQSGYSRITQNKDRVKMLFRKIGNPWGGTPLGRRLSDIFTSHIKKMDEVLPDHPKRLNLIVITDGKPSEQNPLVMKVMVKLMLVIRRSRTSQRCDYSMRQKFAI